MKAGKKLLIPAVLVFILLPVLVHAASSWWPIVPCGTSQNPAACTRCDLFKLLKNVIDFVLIGLMLPLATLFFVWGGFLILMGGARPDLVTRGRAIFWDTFLGVIIILSSWLITNTLIQSVGAKYNGASTWFQYQCVAEAPTAPPTTMSQPPSNSCRQNFGLSPSSGCSNLGSCVNVSSYTPSHGCESNNGVCLLSPDAAAKAQKFIATFNQLSAGSCSLKLSSAIQVNGGPSVSQCHQPGNSKSGTCADFNLLPNHDSCYQKFYQAARDSGAIVSFLDEYVNACVESNSTGGNIHVNFGGGSVSGGPPAPSPESADAPTISSISPEVFPAGTLKSLDPATAVATYTYLDVPFEIQGQDLNGATVAVDNTGVDGKPGIEIKNLATTDTSIKGDMLVHSTAKDGTTSISVQNNAGSTTKDITVTITGTQYLQRTFADNPQVQFYGDWKDTAPSSGVSNLIAEVKRGLGTIGNSDYKSLNIVAAIYEDKSWDLVRCAPDTQSSVNYGCANGADNVIKIRDGGDTDNTILHEGAHKLHFFNLGIYSGAPNNHQKTNFQNQWVGAVGDASACKYLPLSSDKVHWNDDTGAVPHCSFAEAYGASDLDEFFEDVATMTADYVFEPNLFSDYPDPKSDPRYNQKVSILKQYDFLQ